MRYSARILIAVAIGILVTTGCNKQNEAKPAKDQVGVEREVLKAEPTTVNASPNPIQEDFPPPALESVPEMDGQAKFLGFESIDVYRWRGGTLEGWIQFDTEAGPVKHELEVTKIAKVVFAASKDLPYDPRAVSGVVMIAIKKSTKDPSKRIYECVVNIKVVVAPKSNNAGQIPPVPAQLIWGPMTGKASSNISGEIDGSKHEVSFFSTSATGLGATGRLSGDPKTKKTYQVYELKVSADGGK